QPALAQEIRRHDRAGVELQTERVEIDDFVVDAERVVEAALGNAPVQRHLATLEPALELEPGARLRTFVSTPRRLAVARTLAAADSLLRVLHPLRGTQIVE